MAGLDVYSNREVKKDVETDIYKIAHSCENGGDHECVEHPDCGVSLTAQEMGRLW